jgi:hypothetical protein
MNVMLNQFYLEKDTHEFSGRFFLNDYLADDIKILFRSEGREFVYLKFEIHLGSVNKELIVDSVKIVDELLDRSNKSEWEVLGRDLVVEAEKIKSIFEKAYLGKSLAEYLVGDFVVKFDRLSELEDIITVKMNIKCKGVTK